MLLSRVNLSPNDDKCTLYSKDFLTLIDAYGYYFDFQRLFQGLTPSHYSYSKCIMKNLLQKRTVFEKNINSLLDKCCNLNKNPRCFKEYKPEMEPGLFFRPGTRPG